VPLSDSLWAVLFRPIAEKVWPASALECGRLNTIWTTFDYLGIFKMPLA